MDSAYDIFISNHHIIKSSNHHIMQFLKDELIRVANQRTFRLLLNYALEV